MFQIETAQLAEQVIARAAGQCPAMPEPYTRQWINAPFTERLLFTEEQMHAYARECVVAATAECSAAWQAKVDAAVTERLDSQHAAEMARWHARWARLPVDVQDACADADDPLAAGIDELRRRLAAAHQQREASEAAARAEAAKHDATLRKLTEWLADVGLLHYQSHCPRPDRTHGPAWMLREPAMVNGDSCEAWSPKSADACIAAFVGPNV